MSNSISKTFKFEKIAFYGGRRINSPEITVELCYTDKGPELSICGDVWNSKHTDIVMGGQCLDELMQFDSLSCNTLFRKLHRLWKLYHLNGLHSGTEAQEKALLEWKSSGGNFDGCNGYDTDCKYLESIGLLDDNGYHYGSSWLYRAIPDDDLKLIEELLNG